MKVKLEVEVAKEVHEFMKGLKETVKVAKECTKNGWQTAEDLGPVMSAVIQHLMPAIDGIDKASEEWKEDKSAVLKAVMLEGAELVEIFSGK